MKKIQLSDSHFTTVDDEDFEYLSQWRWCLYRPKSNLKSRFCFYAKRSYVDENKKKKDVWLHREIMKAPKGFVVDHIDRNGLNNCRNNLRTCTQQQNSWNTKLLSSNTSGFRGVKKISPTRFRATIRHDNILCCLGCYKTVNEAIIAYNAAALKFRGEFAILNKIPDEL